MAFPQCISGCAARLYLALLLGLLGAMAPVGAQVPSHWISYANLAGNQLQASLSDPANDAVVRLHGWMQERLLRDAPSGPPPPVIVRVWIAGNGRIERVAFDSLGNAQADADMRTLLQAQQLAEPPPRDMRQPLNLQLTLSFVPGS